MNSFGHNFKITIFGESHGHVVGVLIDGVMPGITLHPDDFLNDLDRRRSNNTIGTTPRKEADIPEIISGIYNNATTGAPITILFRNENTQSEDYTHLTQHPRPSHADFAAFNKYKGCNDPRGGGMFSGRMTIALVAAGVVAKKMLPEVHFSTHLTEVGGEQCPKKQTEIISQAIKAGNSVGGIVEVSAHGVTKGTGEPFFDSIESMAAHIIFAIPGIKGIEFGSGFSVAGKSGSNNNDTIIDLKGTTATNNDGGINGGIANGNTITLRAAFKPTPSIGIPQKTINITTGEICDLMIAGRHDACIALRGAVVVESALAIALADLALRAH